MFHKVLMAGASDSPPSCMDFKSPMQGVNSCLCLTIRQTLGGTVSVWNNVTKEAWMFLKEISSDGDVSTVRNFVLYFMACPGLLMLV